MTNPIKNHSIFNDDKNLSKSQPNMAPTLKRQLSSQIEKKFNEKQFPPELIDSAMQTLHNVLNSK